MFGDGIFPDIEAVYHRDLAPYLSHAAHAFWRSRLHYFKRGLYHFGGMGYLTWYFTTLVPRFLCKENCTELMFQTGDLKHWKCVRSHLVTALKMFDLIPTLAWILGG